MSKVVRIPDELYIRLKKYAEPFETPIDVIEKILNKFEGVKPEKPIGKRSKESNTLPITFYPEDMEEFKSAFIKEGKATISIKYEDGSIEKKSWLCRHLTEDSNIIGNVRSKPEFRKENWIKNKIKNVHISV